MTAFLQKKYLLASFFATLLLFGSAYGQNAPAQQLRIKDFAIWGGSGPASPFNKKQGVSIKESVFVNGGSVGGNHDVEIKKDFTLVGSIYSGNTVELDKNSSISGNVTASNRAGNTKDKVFEADKATTIKGYLLSNGKTEIKTGSGKDASIITGKAYVPSPTNTNYTGPTPLQGFSNTFVLPIAPVLPNNTAFDTKFGTTDVTTTRVLQPGSYRNLTTKGQTITFNGPGNYIFLGVDNKDDENTLIFDFKNTTTGTINIYVVGDAQWGKLTVKMVNGNDPTRVFTEVHGTGSKNGGSSFEVKGSKIKTSPYLTWAGTVWAPNGDINIGKSNTSGQDSVNISGSLWSGTAVNISSKLRISYVTTQIEPNFINPYYAPPATGKVDSANNKVGAELTSLTLNPTPIISTIDNSIFRFDGNNVFIEIISKLPNDANLLNQLIAGGLTGIVNNGPQLYVISGFYPISGISALNNNPAIQYVRPLYPPILNAGQVTSKGDLTMRSNFVRDRFGVDGENVKVGVLSNSYNRKFAAQLDVDQGDLPGIRSNGTPNPLNANPVQILLDYPSPASDEGRAMLQIVHDVAPKSKLAFRTGFLTAGDFAQGILDLADPLKISGGRCDVIVDDITYITEPFLRDGTVAKVVDQVAAQGVTYFSSAGNFGNKSYESTFTGVSVPSIIPAPATLHRFGSTAADFSQRIKLNPGNYTIVLQWSDDFYSLGSPTGVQTDLDLYLLNSTGFPLFGFNRSNIFGDPFEVCPFTVTDTTTARLIVVNAKGNNSGVRFKYIIFAGDGTIVDYNSGGSTIVGHPNAKGAIAIGAYLYENIPQFTPVYPAVASFSSRGGTNTLNAATGQVEVRQKPEYGAPNGVNTTVNLGGPVFNDGDPFPNFFGTSAAAPHAAAAAALLIQAKKKFELVTTVTPANIRTLLTAGAGKFVGQTGFDFANGFGLIRADSSVQQIANARPIVKSLSVVPPNGQTTGIPGEDPFMVKVTGSYLNANTQVYFNGMPVTSTTVVGDTVATAMVPGIPVGEDYPIQLNNAAKSPSGVDGGLSEALFFFSNRKDVTIRAENSSRKFGQENPTFTAKVLVDGLPIEQTNISLADLKLNNLKFTTLATATSNAGLYSIIPARVTNLAADDSLQIKYSFTFVSGTLSIDKMKVKITPQNKTIKYGDYLGEVTYNYEFEQSSLNNTDVLNQVQAAHKEYLADNAVAVMNNFDTVTTGLGAIDFANMSMIASYQSVSNARKFSIENGQLRGIVNQLPEEELGQQRFLIDVSAESLVNYKANNAQSIMVNALPESAARAMLNIKSLSNGSAKAALPNGQLQPMVNGQLLAMVNGQLRAVVNGQLRAVVNGVEVDAADIIFQNGQLRGLVNGEWVAISNGQLRAVVNGEEILVNLSIENGQLRAVVNGQLMAVVNGQLQALVNGQLLAVVNGQLQALVNGQLMPVVNGQLMAVVNGQLRAVVNGQLLALVNGQLMAVVNGRLEQVQDLSFTNGQLRAVVNGQLLAVVNGQLKAMVNGIITDVPTTELTFTNGQLRAVVNGQLQAVVNGQLRAVVNGQLRAVVNGDLTVVEQVTALSNGQLRAVVNGTNIPIANGQLQAIVNGQLLAMVNGQLMAVVNGELTFAVFANGQLMALVNGQLQPVVNGQLQALVNGQLQAVVNSAVSVQVISNNTLTPVDSYSYTNGQLRAVVNGAEITTTDYTFTNGQLRAVVNGATYVIPNGQLTIFINGQENVIDLSVTNGQLRAVVNGTTEFSLVNGQLRAVVNGQLLAVVNGQLRAVVNGQLQAVVNGQLQALVNGQLQALVNGQLLAVVNGQLQAVVNNFTITGNSNNANTVVLVDENDLTLQGGSIGGMFAVNMMTGTGVGTHKLIPGAFINDNYEVTYGLGEVTIERRPLLIKPADTSKVYGSTDPTIRLKADGFAFDQTLADIEVPSISVARGTNLAVGTYTITLSGGGSDTYELILDTATLTVLKKELIVTADDQFKEYGNANPTFTLSYQGFIAGEDQSNITPPTITAVPENTNAGEYIITLSGGSAANYQLTLVNGTFKIRKAPLLFTANGATVTYGQPDPPFTFSVEGFKLGQNINSPNILAPTLVTNAPLNRPAGTWLLTFTGGESLNYDYSFVPGTYTIDKRPITVTADNQTRVFGAANPPLTATITNLVNGDTQASLGIVLSTTAVSTSPAGDYPITVPTLNLANYSVISSNDGVLSVTGVNPSITCPANIIVNNTTGQNGANVTFAATDNVGNPASTITYSQPSGSFFPIGSTVITATATNTVGSSECTFTVTVVDNERPVIACPSNIPLNLNGSSAPVTISSIIVNNEIIISSSSVAQSAVGGLLPVQNDNTKTLSGSCDCPPGHAVVGYEGRTGEIVDQFKLICAPINSDGSPGVATATSCYNGGTGGGPVVPIIAPAGSWISGFQIGDMTGYFNRSGTLNSIRGYSQTFADVINGSTNRFLNTEMRGEQPIQRTTVQYAPLGSVITGMNYYIDPVAGGPFSSAVQFKYQPLVATQELARITVTDNSSGNLTVALSGNTTFTSANIGTNPITIQVTDASGNLAVCTTSITIADNIAPTANCQPITVSLVNGTASVTASQVNNNSTDNSNGPLTYNFLVGNNNGQRTVAVNSGTRSGRELTGITYTYNGQQQTLTPANAVRSTLILSSLTANPIPGTPGDANRFWDATATTMTEATALRVLGDFDLGTALQDCADPEGVNHKVVFDRPITTGAGPEIFIVHGGLAFDIEILDVNGNVALTIPASEIANGSNVTIGGTAFSGYFNAFYLRNNVNYAVEYIPGHYNSQDQVLALDINSNEVPVIGGIRFGGGGCNYVYEILGNQPPLQPASDITFTSSNIGENPVILQVTDASGNSSTCTTTITVLGDNTAPLVLCKPVTVNLGLDGTGTITADQVDNGSTDNVGIVSKRLSKSTFTCADKSSSALRFDAGADGVTTNSNFSSVTGTSARTISAWVNPSVPNFTYAIAHQGDQDAPAGMFGIGIQQGNKLSFWGGYNDYVSSLTVPLNKWSYVAITYGGGGTYTLYLNGQSETFFLAQSNTLASKFFVGHETTDNGVTYRNQFLGSVDEVKVYNRALNASEIIDDQTGNPYPNNLVLYYPFSEGAGTSITDASGQGNNATLTPTIANNSNWIYRGPTTTLTVTDASGNSSICEAEVIVLDNTAPTITCPANISERAPVTTGKIINYTLPVANDNCTGVTVTRIAGPASGDNFPVGVTIVTHRATDAAGLTTDCSFTVTVLDPCIVNLWNAENGYADAASSANGTPVGGVSLSKSAPHSGTRSFLFDGSTGHIDLGTAPSLSGTGYFSVSAWVKTTSNQPMVVIAQRGDDIDGEYILKVGGIHSYPAALFNTSDAAPGKAYFFVYGSGAQFADLISTTNVNDGQWHQIRGERINSNVYLYVDGILEASGSTGITVNMGGTIPTTIGYDLKDNNAFFNGNIDDIQINTCEPLFQRQAAPQIVQEKKVVTQLNLDTKSFKESIYPNPATNSIRVQLTDKVQSINHVIIMDVVGKTTQIKNIRLLTDSLLEIDISNLGKGVHFIKVPTNAGERIFRFIKL